jgi:hypothetical protein
MKLTDKSPHAVTDALAYANVYLLSVWRGATDTAVILRQYFQAYVNMFLLTGVEFLGNWPKVLTDPFGCFLSFFVIPVGNSFLIILGSIHAVLRFFTHYVLHSPRHDQCMSTDNLFHDLSDHQIDESSHMEVCAYCASRTTVVNWFDPVMVTTEDISKGLDLMTRDNLTSSLFSFEVAKALLCLSAYTYEADLGHMDCYISQCRLNWGLKVIPVTIETTPMRTAFIFFSEQLNLIVLAFKGTDPFNVYEIFIDSSVQKVDGRAFVYGGVHQGFYTTLFRKRRIAHPKGDSNRMVATEDGEFFVGEEGVVTSHQLICDMLAKVTQRIQQARESSDKPNLWVTGHSLGAALATLFYARHMKCKESKHIATLRGGYVFGSPRVGNFDFAQEFVGLCNNKPSFHRTTKLWRVVNANDLVPRLPLGTDYLRFSRVGGGSGQSSLDYFHVGKGVYLHERLPPSFQLSDHTAEFSLSSTIKYLFGITDDYICSWKRIAGLVDFARFLLQSNSAEFKDPKTRVRILRNAAVAVIPTGVYDHTPASYMACLKSAPYQQSYVEKLSFDPRVALNWLKEALKHPTKIKSQPALLRSRPTVRRGYNCSPFAKVTKL